MIPRWFLYIGGFSLVILGVLQIIARPRKSDASLYERFVNIGTMWSLICITVGAGLLAMALGYWAGPLGGQPPESPKPAKHHRH
jgi:hypothetical protein